MASDESRADELLISRFQRGETEAFDRLMSLHAGKVFGVAWGVLRDREDAVDAVQEVFIRLHKQLPRMDSGDNLTAWLYRVCLNHCIDQKRKTKRTPVEMSEEDWDRLRGPDDLEPHTRVGRSEISGTIWEAVGKLPERQRIVFTLRHFRLLSVAETASAMGCSTGAVKAHLSRATAHLRDDLRDALGAGYAEVHRK